MILHIREEIQLRKPVPKTCTNLKMKELATPTGDVYKNWDIREDEKIYFLLQCKENEFTIGLGDLLECLKFAEEKGEVPALPCDWWADMMTIYPQLCDIVEVPDDEDEEI